MTDTTKERHIVSSYDRDLHAIQALVVKMGTLAETAILQSVEALEKGDQTLAEYVRLGDSSIDELEERAGSEAALLLARRQPIASDLRTVLSVMKIAANLERIGDFAKNNAKRAIVLADLPSVEGAPAGLRRMATAADAMLKDAMDAFIRRDADLAEDVRQRDVEIDQMYNSQFREFLTFMLEDPRNITACTHLHFIAKNIERIGDSTTSIAEQVIYLSTGRLPEDERPKDDRTAVEMAGAYA